MISVDYFMDLICGLLAWWGYRGFVYFICRSSICCLCIKVSLSASETDRRSLPTLANFSVEKLGSCLLALIFWKICVFETIKWTELGN